MDFKDLIKNLSKKTISTKKDSLLTEEATKNALIMPFIMALGYDVFDPTEVVPEMDCDITKKKGDKIDYAIFMNGEPIILIECKHWEENLDNHEGQLKKYFVASKAKFGILTNGIEYRFYSDLDNDNMMDEECFFKFNITNITDEQIDELKKYHKSYFDEDAILSGANDLKYTSKITGVLLDLFENPSIDFVKSVVKQFYDRPVTQSRLDQFKPIIKDSINRIISDKISERLKAAMKTQEEKRKQEEEAAAAEQIDAAPVQEPTREEEIAANIVVAIASSVIEPSRLTPKWTNSYHSVVLDGSSRKPICRLYVNNPRNMHIDIPDGGSWIRIEIVSLSGIYALSEQIQQSARRLI